MNDTRANQWVPVSERLPDTASQKLLLLRNYVQRTGYAHCGIWFLDGSTDSEAPGSLVTHWMDLPEPPEPPKPVDPFEAWWASLIKSTASAEIVNVAARWVHRSVVNEIWNAAKEHYAKPKDYQRGLEDSAIAFESMVNRILEGKDDGTGRLEIPELEKLRRVLLERLKPLPDFDTWAKAYCADGPYLAAYWHPIAKQLIHIDNARGIWNAAQGQPEA